MPSKLTTTALYALCLSAALLIAACSPVPIAEPVPTLSVIRVQITPALRDYHPVLADCAAGVQGLGLDIQEMPASSLDLDRADLSIRLGLPEETAGYSASLGSTRIVVLTQDETPVDEISLAELALLYQRQPGGGAPSLLLHTYLPGDDLRQAFEDVLGTTAGRLTVEVPIQEAALEVVSGQPNTAGFFLTGAGTSGLKALEISGTQPGDWNVPVIALAKQEPEGLARSFLACLQTKTLSSS